MLCGLFFPLRTAQAVINMAVVAPRAGELKIFGDELVNGVKIAVDDYNRQGGVLGERINLVIVDDQCDDTLAVSTAQMMAVNSSEKDKMDVVIGPYCSNSFDRVAAIYASAKIFQIIPISVSREAAASRYDGLVKMVGSIEQQGEDFYHFYLKNFDGKPVALVYDSSMREVVEIAAEVQKQFLSGNRLKLLKSYNFANYKDNLSRMTEEIVGDQNEIVYVLGKAKAIAKLSRDIIDEKNDMVIFTDRYQARDTYRQLMGDLAEGSYMTALPSFKNRPDFTETLVRLRLQGMEPEGLGMYGYAAVGLWQELAGKAGTLDYNALAKALVGSKLETAWGEAEYSGGNPLKSLNYGIYRLENGEYTQVY